SGKQSCASCHDPAHAHAQPNALAVQLGGLNLDQPGFRSVPSLRYLASNPAFFFDEEDTPTGGLNRDGSAQGFEQQAQRPFLAAHEMGNGSPAEVVARLENAAYAADFKQAFGQGGLEAPAQAFRQMLAALAAYMAEDPEFQPF